jgi:hypothetical protein
LERSSTGADLRAIDVHPSQKCSAISSAFLRSELLLSMIFGWKKPTPFFFSNCPSDPMGYSDTCADLNNALTEGGYHTRALVSAFIEEMQEYLQRDPPYPKLITERLIELASEYLAVASQANLVKLVIAANQGFPRYPSGFPSGT